MDIFRGKLQRENLEKIVKEKKLTDSFIFLGFKENPYKYMSKCDIYVCSSRREGFSTAVTEALVIGLPCVSTNCSGAYELLGRNDEYGIVTENSEEGIYFGLKKMLLDRQLFDCYKKQAELRGKKFNMSETVKAVEDMVDELVK